MKFILSLFNKIVKWFLKKSNLDMIDATLKIAKQVSKISKTKKDDDFIDNIATIFRDATAGLSERKMKVLAKSVTEASEGDLKDVKIEYSPSVGVVIKKGPIGICYNPKNGGVNFRLSI